MCQHCGCGCDDDDCSCIDEESDAEFEFALVARQGSRVMGAMLQQFSRGLALAILPVRFEFSLARRRGEVIAVATRRGLLLGLPAFVRGRPRRLDYTELSVLLASGVSHAEAGRRLGVSRSAVSKAWHRNRELRRRVNRVEHAAFG